MHASTHARMHKWTKVIHVAINIIFQNILNISDK